MRILLLNPNMTASVTDLMADAGRAVAAAGTELVGITATRGMPYISTRTEAQIGGVVALEMLSEHGRGVDAAIIAAFGDPGVPAAKELFDFPVVGVSEAAMLTACLLGQRFAIVTFSASLIGWYRDCVALNGMLDRCTGIFSLDISFADMAGDQVRNGDLLVELAERVVQETGADCLIFGGAPLAGLAARVSGRMPVPVVDPVAAAVKQSEALVSLRPRKAVAGSFQRPPAKTNWGLHPLLADRISHNDTRI